MFTDREFLSISANQIVKDARKKEIPVIADKALRELVEILDGCEVTNRDIPDHEFQESYEAVFGAARKAVAGTDMTPSLGVEELVAALEDAVIANEGQELKPAGREWMKRAKAALTLAKEGK